MPTTVIASIGSRTSDAVTVSTVTSTTVSGYSNAWSVALSATVPSTTKIGDKLTTGANSYLITGISGSTLTVVGDANIAITSTSAPSTGSATTARAYSSIKAGWFDGSPANLTTQDSGNGWIWKGELYKEGGGTNGEWALGGSYIAFGTKTVSSTAYFRLAAAPGQGIADNANKLTNALRYNNANGVAISTTTFGVFIVQIGYFQFEGLQISNGSTSNGSNGTITADGQAGTKVISCILQSARTDANFPILTLHDSLAYIANSLVVSNGQHAVAIYNNGVASSTTIYNAGAVGTTQGINSTGGLNGPIAKNVAIFGFSTVLGGSYTSFNSSSNYNATNLSPSGVNWGANSLTGKTAANQFTSLTSGSEDFRVKAGSDLVAGTRDQTYTNDLDIVGSARSTTTPTIGAWEFPSVTYSYARPASDITTQWTPSTGTDHYALIDETTANDADYIYATAAGQTDEVRLASMSAPQAGTDLLINYRVQGIVGSASVTLSLVCNTTVHATDTARTANGDYTLTVPSGTWASVADWTNMRLRFVSA
jgi:hypothetical protein